MEKLSYENYLQYDRQYRVKRQTQRRRKNTSKGALLVDHESFLETKNQSSLAINLQFLTKGAIGLSGRSILKW